MRNAHKYTILVLIILLWSCVSVRANEVVVAFVNGAPQGILWHDKDNWTMYVSPYLVVNADRFTKHYYAGSQRIASKIGAGEFNNLYDASKACVTAGQKDYAERLNLITQSRNDYYAALGIPPGPPTAKGIYGEAEYSGMYGEYVIEPLGDYSVPTGWPMKPYKRPYGGTPGAPVMYEKPSDPEDEGAGYGYSNAEGLEENDIYFYHSDHLGSTSYITDKDGNTTQFVSYKPYGEALVDEHATSFESPWKFNGKELDAETGLYYYGARYYEPVMALWYGVDALTEKTTEKSGYVFCSNNPINRIDNNGCWDINVHVYNDRKEYGYGIAIVSDRNGNEVFRFKVRVEGSGGHDRLKSNSDTPLGIYDITDNGTWLSGGDRGAYGPNPRLSLIGQSGEIVESNRSNIRVHGGRQENYDKNTKTWTAKKNPELKKTHGCMRAYDSDMILLKNITDNLQANDESDFPGVLEVTADLIKNIYPINGNYIEVETRYEIPNTNSNNISPWFNINDDEL